MTTNVNYDDLEGVMIGDIPTLRFRPDSIKGLVYIRNMLISTVLEPQPGTTRLVEMLCSSSDWGNDDNRTMQFAVGLFWDRQEFERRTRSILESLVVGGA